MLSYAHRFHGYNSLRYVYKNGATVRSSQMSLKYAVNTRRKTWRCSIIVSRKVNKSAVVRNRIRRRIYEVVRLQATKITEPYDLVFTVFDEQVAVTPIAELTTAVKTSLERAGVLSPSNT